VSQIRSHFYLYDNLGRCGPISTIRLPLHLVINCESGTCKRFHFTPNLMPFATVHFIQSLSHSPFGSRLNRDAYKSIKTSTSKSRIGVLAIIICSCSSMAYA